MSKSAPLVSLGGGAFEVSLDGPSKLRITAPHGTVRQVCEALTARGVAYQTRPSWRPTVTVVKTATLTVAIRETFQVPA